VIGKQLQRNDFEEWHEQLRWPGKFDDVVGGFAREMVSIGYDGDYDAVARLTSLMFGNALFIACHCFRVGFVASGEHDNRQILVDQRVRAMLHLAGGVAFGVNVRDFLELQSTFECDRVVDASAEIEESVVAEKNCRARFFRKKPVSSACKPFSILCGMRVNSCIKVLAASSVILPRT